MRAPGGHIAVSVLMSVSVGLVGDAHAAPPELESWTGAALRTALPRGWTVAPTSSGVQAHSRDARARVAVERLALEPTAEENTHNPAALARAALVRDAHVLADEVSARAASLLAEAGDQLIAVAVRLEGPGAFVVVVRAPRARFAALGGAELAEAIAARTSVARASGAAGAASAPVPAGRALPGEWRYLGAGGLTDEARRDDRVELRLSLRDDGAYALRYRARLAGPCEVSMTEHGAYSRRRATLRLAPKRWFGTACVAGAPVPVYRWRRHERRPRSYVFDLATSGGGPPVLTLDGPCAPFMRHAGCAQHATAVLRAKFRRSDIDRGD